MTDITDNTLLATPQIADLRQRALLVCHAVGAFPVPMPKGSLLCSKPIELHEKTQIL